MVDGDTEVGEQVMADGPALDMVDGDMEDGAQDMVVQ